MHKRNLEIDLLKYILTFFVVLAHVMPYTFTHEYQINIAYFTQGLARVTVPVFFLISGYYIKNKLNNYTEIKLILLRFLKIYIAWQIIYAYLIFLFYKNNLFNTSDVIFNIFYGFGHLWFINALILGVFLLYTIKINKTKSKIIIAIVLLLIGYVFQKIAQTSTNTTLLTINKIIGTSRNFLFFGYPYLLIGTIVDQIKLKHITLGFWFFLFGLLFETYCYKLLKIPISDIFIMAIPLSVYTFKITQKFKLKFQFSINSKVLFAIYLVHFYPVLYATIYITNNSFEYVLLKICLVFISSYILAYIIYFLDKRLKFLL